MKRFTSVGAPALVVFDQVTKWIVPHVPEFHLVPWFVEVRYDINTGGWLGWGTQLASTVRRPFFVSCGVAAVALLAWLYLRLEGDQRTLSIGLMVLIAGATSNLLDRVVSGHVVDVLHLHLGGIWEGAAFNMADVYILSGMLLVAWEASFGDGGSIAGAARSR